MLHTPLALTFITTINTLIDAISNVFAQRVVIFLVWDPFIEYTRQPPEMIYHLKDAGGRVDHLAF